MTQAIHAAPTFAAAALAAALVIGSTAPASAQQGFSFRNCTEARAAGYSNIRRGAYGYGRHLDRDNDGIACET